MPRKASVDITYTPKGKIPVRTASEMAKYENEFSYTDSATGESDTVSLKLHNVDLRWAGTWLPKVGDKLEAEIVTEGWEGGEEEQKFSCGKFCCDDISFTGPEYSCVIGGVSVPEGQAFRATERSYTWKKVTVQEAAQKIADRYSMELQYDASKISIESMEQNKQTDCNFLNSLCENYGLCMKVYAGRIVIYDADVYEAKDAVAAYSIRDFEDWNYSASLTGTYTGATVSYTDGKGKKKKELSVTVGTEERLLYLNEKADSMADAQAKAIAAVNRENRSAVTMSATIPPNMSLAAGACITVTGAYTLNGKYFLDKVTHRISADSAYTMSLEMHKVLEKIKAESDDGSDTAASDTAFAVGDKVLVNGPAYYAGNGGRANQCSNMTMYITQILGDSYRYQYGVAKRKGGTRYGWCARDSLTKA